MSSPTSEQRDAILAVLRESQVPLDAYQVGRLSAISPMLAGQTLWKLAEDGVVESLHERGTLNDLAAQFRFAEKPATASRRRTLATFGAVNFPFDDPRYRSSKEGGMFVKLVVVDDREYDESDWTICVGASVLDHKQASLVGDDQAACPVLGPSFSAETPEQALNSLDQHNEAAKAWESRHFPMLHSEGVNEPLAQFMTRPYLASLVLGNTGWSGLSEDTTEYWVCRYENLTDQGKAVYDQLKALYPGCQLHLLTFLDT